MLQEKPAQNLRKSSILYIVTCPRHLAQFDVTTGRVVSHPKMPLIYPKAHDEPTYEVKIDQEDIMVEA